MDKNNSKTIYERTHTSMDLVRKSGNIQKEEISEEFNSKIDTKNIIANYTSQKSIKKQK